jgi:hypothetical protein
VRRIVDEIDDESEDDVEAHNEEDLECQDLPRLGRQRLSGTKGMGQQYPQEREHAGRGPN